MAEVERHCGNCEHGILCSTFGDYKCLVKKCRIYEPEKDAAGCVDFKKKRVKLVESERKCRCGFCQKRAKDLDE